MKKSELKELIKECLLEEELLEEGRITYKLLPDKIIKNELYNLGRTFPAFVDRMINGSDYKDEISGFIKALKMIEKTAKEFPAGQEPDIKGYGGKK